MKHTNFVLLIRVAAKPIDLTASSHRMSVFVCRLAGFLAPFFGKSIANRDSYMRSQTHGLQGTRSNPIAAFSRASLHSA